MLSLRDVTSPSPSTAIVGDFSDFLKHAAHVRTIYTETRESYNEVQSSMPNSALVEHATLPDGAHKTITQLYKHSPALCVLGRTHLKSLVVNELLGEAVLPSVQGMDERWRMIRFQYAENRYLKHVSQDSDLSDEYEVASHRTASQDEFQSISRQDLVLHSTTGSRDSALAEIETLVEVGFNHQLFGTGVELILPATTDSNLASVQNPMEVMLCVEGYLPFFIYPMDVNEPFTQEDRDQIQCLKTIAPASPILFICIDTTTMSSPLPPVSTTEVDGKLSRRDSIDDRAVPSKIKSIYDHLSAENYFQDPTRSVSPEVGGAALTESDGFLCSVESDVLTNSSAFRPLHQFVEDFSEFPRAFVHYIRRNLRHLITCAANTLAASHNNCLRTFICAAFDMARDVQVTPRRIEYAKKHEEKLYGNLLETATKKQEEIRKLVTDCVADLQSQLYDDAARFEFRDVTIPKSLIVSNRVERLCNHQIQEMVFARLNSVVSTELVRSMNVMRDGVIGTLSRCLDSLEDDLAAGKDGESERSATTRKALRDILDAAYQLEFNKRAANSSIQLLLERFVQILTSVSRSQTKIDALWKKRVARGVVQKMNASQLARSLCSQFRTKLVRAHQIFLTSIQRLDNEHSMRLQEMEEQRNTVKKILAPKIARLCLLSTSLCDLIQHGLPRMGKEIGRGQYGVVYACDPWGGHANICVKSVVPPDEKHWNDLALEFHYTWSLPYHDRIVALRGCIVDDSYGSGSSSSAVLLVMDRLKRDLYQGIKSGLNLRERLQVALDVVEGIRFLHNQGLIHRDIKLKNVLLDDANRGKITDLGFCKPEAMMSASIVGTPIHMAPELFSGHYDSSVDVYAFGILLWYICKGTVKLPTAYDRCHSKDQLWSSVKRGLRPDRLPQFSDEAWDIMEGCWNMDPKRRYLLGHVQPKLEELLANTPP